MTGEITISLVLTLFGNFRSLLRLFGLFGTTQRRENHRGYLLGAFLCSTQSGHEKDGPYRAKEAVTNEVSPVFRHKPGEKSHYLLILLLIVQQDVEPGRQAEKATAEPHQKAKLSAEERARRHKGYHRAHTEEKADIEPHPQEREGSKNAYRVQGTDRLGCCYHSGDFWTGQGGSYLIGGAKLVIPSRMQETRR